MKVGFISIIGRPNVGKSSLLNKILNYKLAITTSTPQTTRNQIRGIYNDSDSQIIFIDTPGIHKPKQKLGAALNENSYAAMNDIDSILFLQPLNEEIGPGDRHIISKIGDKPKIAVITKLDKGDEEAAKKRAEELKHLGFQDVLGVSIEIESSINHLIDFLKTKINEGHPFYNTEDVSDVSTRFVAQEIIRESAIENTREEVPHAIGIEITDFHEPQNENESFEIYATIYVEKESQKGILIGKSGAMIKKIGIESREKLEPILGSKLYLNLKVKVNKNWTNNEEEIKRMGY